MQGASQIQGRGDGMVASLTIILLPGLTYFAGHYGVIFEYEHFWSLALLWSLPLLFICGLPGVSSEFLLSNRQHHHMS